MGTCPEATEPRASASAEPMLTVDVDETHEAQLQEDVQACFADEDCSALEAQFAGGSSLAQLSDVRQDSFVGSFFLFLAIFVVCIIFWPIAWLFIVSWLFVSILLTPFMLLAMPSVSYDGVQYHLGSFDYLVDEFCRPVIAPIGLP